MLTKQKAKNAWHWFGFIVFLSAIVYVLVAVNGTAAEKIGYVGALTTVMFSQAPSIVKKGDDMVDSLPLPEDSQQHGQPKD